MKILVTGAKGYAASSIISTLAPKYDLILTSRSKGTFNQNIPIIPLDLTNSFATNSFLEEYFPDIIIHTAAITSIDYSETHQDETQAINVKAVETLCQYCEKTSTWLIHFSTDAIFSGEHAPYSEKDIPHPINYYGKSKLMGEQIIQNNQNFPFTICRPSVIYGWKATHHRGNLFYDFYSRLYAGEKVYASQIHYGNPTYLEDLGRCVDQIIKRKIHGILHTVGPVRMNKYEFALELASIFEFNPKLIQPIAHHPGKAPRPHDLALYYEDSIQKLELKMLSPRKAFKVLFKKKRKKGKNNPD
ncbi:MAG: SDR family oxidoreductase [Promethearchaeota archaeon]